MLCFPLDNVEYEAKALGAWLATRTRGVFSAEGNLAVSPGGGMAVLVGRGLAWLKADEYWGTVCFLEEGLTLPLGEAHPALPRIDAVCVQLDKNAAVAGVVVKQGEYAHQPEMPPPVRDLNLDEIVLATVAVPAGAVQVEARHITDCRLDEGLCGLMRDGVSGIPTETLQAQAAGLIDLVESELGRLNAGAECMLKTEYAPDATAELRDGVLRLSSLYRRAGDQYDVRFTVPQGYEAGMPVEIDGAAVTVRDGDGDAADLDAAPGTPGWLVRRGASAFFRAGGGAKVQVKGGATQPERPRGNSLWVETGQPITKTIMAAALPAGQQPEGTVWVRTGTESNAAFNAGGKNPLMVYPKAAAQLQAGSWVGRPLRAYVDGQWRGCGRVVVPNLLEWPLAAWASNFWRGAAAGGGITGTLVPTDYGIGYVYTAVDVTDWTSLSISCNYVNNYRLDYNFYLCLGYSNAALSFTDSYSTTTGLPAMQVVAIGKTITSGVLSGSFNVAALKGVIYVGLRYYGNAYYATRSVGYTINSIELT